jgi:predicted dehydrogenase
VHIPAFISEGLEVVAVCASRQERAQDAADTFSIPNIFTDYREMLNMESLDAVSIASPPALHHQMAIDSLDAGKHVICEKPFALNQDEAYDMWKKAEGSELTAMIAHEFRFASARMRTKELIREGYIGNLHMALISLANGPRNGFTPRPITSRDYAEQGGGFLWALGSHYIDCLRDWFGNIISVTGHVQTHYGERINQDDDGVINATSDDAFTFTVQFEQGGLATMNGTNAAPFGSGAKVEIYGSDGTLITPHVGTGVNPPAHGSLLGANKGDKQLEGISIPDRLETVTDDRDDRIGPFRLLVREFIKGVNEGYSPTPNFYDGYKCQQVLDAVRVSSKTGVRIKIPMD